MDSTDYALNTQSSMIRLAVATLALHTACGSRTQIDAAPDAAHIGDAVSEQVVCDLASPFTSISALDLDTDADEFDVRLAEGELTAYFISNRARPPGSGNDVFVAHRSSLTTPFASPILLDGLAQPYATANDPNPTGDNLEIIFEGGCTNVLNHPPTLCGSRRATLDGAFGAPFVINVGSPSSPGKFGGSAYIVGTGHVLYFRPLYLGDAGAFGRASREVTSDFGVIEPVAVSDAPTGPAPLYAPVVSLDERQIFFAATQGSTSTIWSATRSDVSQSFSNAHVLAEIVDHTYPNWLSEDGCRLYFTREAPTDAGIQRDLFVAAR